MKIALGIFAASLIANVAWSIIFFGASNPYYALIDIFLLWVLVLLMIVAFYRISKPAAHLLLPYVCWVSFAMYLNYMIYALNLLESISNSLRSRVHYLPPRAKNTHSIRDAYF